MKWMVLAAVLVVTVFALGQEVATTQATTDDLLAIIEQLRTEIAELQQQNQTLLAQLNARPGAARAKSITTAPVVPAKAWTSIEQILRAMPRGTYPETGRSWNGFMFTKADEWLRQNVIGTKMTIRLKYMGGASENRDRDSQGISARVSHNIQKVSGKSLLPGYTDANGVEWYISGIGCVFSFQERAKIEKLRDGDSIMITGTIASASVERNNPSSSKVKQPAGKFFISLRDCQLK